MKILLTILHIVKTPVKILAKILRRAIIFLLLVAIIVVGYMKMSGYQLLTVTTGSMSPMCSEGDKIIVKPISFDELTVGDVITFKSGSDNITHEVIEINADKRTVITKGINNFYQDVAPVTEDEIIGVVVFNFGVFTSDIEKPLTY